KIGGLSSSAPPAETVIAPITLTAMMAAITKIGICFMERPFIRGRGRRARSARRVFLKSLTQRPERGSELRAEKLWLFPGREVTALIDVEIDQVPIGVPGPCLRGSIDLLRKYRDGHRERDLGGLLRDRGQDVA